MAFPMLRQKILRPLARPIGTANRSEHGKNAITSHFNGNNKVANNNYLYRSHAPLTGMQPGFGILNKGAPISLKAPLTGMQGFCTGAPINSKTEEFIRLEAKVEQLQKGQEGLLDKMMDMENKLILLTDEKIKSAVKDMVIVVRESQLNQLMAAITVIGTAGTLGGTYYAFRAFKPANHEEVSPRYEGHQYWD